MELSRQRLRPSIFEASTQKCTHCEGLGVVRSVQSWTLQALRALETEAIKLQALNLEVSEITMTLLPDVCMYLINNKRDFHQTIEDRFKVKIILCTDAHLGLQGIKIDYPRKKDVHKFEKTKKQDVKAEHVAEAKKIHPIKSEHVVVEKQDVLPVLEKVEGQEEGPKKLSRSARRRKNRQEKQKNKDLEPQTPEVVAAGTLEVENEVEVEVVEAKIEEVEKSLETPSVVKRKKTRSRKRNHREDRKEDQDPVIQSVSEEKTKQTQTANQLEKNMDVGKPLFGNIEQKKLVLDGETFKLGRPLSSSMPLDIIREISEDKIKTEIHYEKKEHPLAATSGSTDEKTSVAKSLMDQVSKKEKAWWQKLLK
jgi:ribonuclease E